MKNLTIIDVTGDDVWQSFSKGIMEVIEMEEAEPENCQINYYGSFGEDKNDEWLYTVPYIFEKVNSVIIYTEDLSKCELNVVKHAIKMFDLPTDKCILR